MPTSTPFGALSALAYDFLRFVSRPHLAPIPASHALRSVIVQQRHRLVVRPAPVLSGLTAPTYPSPLADHGPTAEQGLRNRQPVVPRHIAGPVDAFEVDFGRHSGIVADTDSRMQA